MEITEDTTAIVAVGLSVPSEIRLREQTRGSELVSAPSLPCELGMGLFALFKGSGSTWSRPKAASESSRQIPQCFLRRPGLRSP